MRASYNRQFEDIKENLKRKYYICNVMNKVKWPASW